MKPFTFGTLAAAMLWVVIAAGPALASAAAGADSGEAETFRAELDAFFASFAGREDLGASAAAARAQLAGLPPEVVVGLQQKLESLPQWRQLPRVTALLEEAEAAHRSRQAAIQDEATTAELETFRSDFLFFVAKLRAFAPLIPHPDYDRGLAEAERMIRDFPSDRLGELRAFYYERSPGWKAMFRAPRTAGGPGALDAGKAFSDCEPTFDFDCSFGDVECFFSAIETAIVSSATAIGCYGTEIGLLVLDFFNEIAGFFNSLPGVLDDIGDFFLGLWDTIVVALEAIWNALLDALPNTPEEILALLGLDVLTTLHTDPSKLEKDAESFWLEFADGFVQGFTLSVDCNLIGLSIGDDLSIFGVVGTPRAEWICKRGLDWLSEFIWKIIPGDTAGLPIKLGYGILVHYPIKFFCTCLEAQSAVCFDNSQASHRALVDALLDEDLSSRATDTAMADLRALLDTLRDTEIARVQTGVDAAGLAIADVDVDVAGVQALVDSLAVVQGDQAAFIDAFQALELRLDIEENLMLREADQATAEFQFPQALGGELETVREVVEQTIVLTTAAGLETFDALLALALADAQFAEGAFEKAYENYRLAYREAIRVGK